MLPDFVMVARGFGWQARRVDRRDELDDALRECLASPGPFFLDVRVAAEEIRHDLIHTLTRQIAQANLRLAEPAKPDTGTTPASA